MVKQSTGSAKRFGARYGRTNRERVAGLEKQYRTRSECPYCKKQSVKRKAAGIFECRGCKSTFTGKAYSVAR